jgi:MFS superfamily sulfate permease-like transporter
MVRLENGLFFANAAGLHEAIIDEVNASAEPVKAVLIDLGATTDLDVPGADMLTELHKELHSRNIRCILARLILPVRQILERAGAMEEIPPEDILTEPTEAVLDYLTTQYDDAGIQWIIRSGLFNVLTLVQKRLAQMPEERRAAYTAFAARLDEEMNRFAVDGQP